MATQAGRKEGVRSTHTTSFKPDEVKTQLSLNLSTFEEWSELVNEMATYKVDLDTVQDFYGDLFVYDEKDRELSRTDRLALVQDNKTVEALQTLFFGGGLGSTMESSQGTLWGLLNSVTEYVDHRRNTQTIDARIDQAWFGSFANIKSKAWDNAVLMVR
jgi:hypothetical protein